MSVHESISQIILFIQIFQINSKFCTCYLHHLHEVLLLHEPLIKLVFLCSELCWVRISATQMLKIFHT